MLTIDTLLERELHKLLKEEITRLKDQLAVNTYERTDQFRYVMGKIASLVAMDDLINEAKKKADQSNR
jgi:hypothetical protein